MQIIFNKLNNTKIIIKILYNKLNKLSKYYTFFN